MVMGVEWKANSRKLMLRHNRFSCTKSFIVMLQKLSHWKNLLSFSLLIKYEYFHCEVRNHGKGTIWKALLLDLYALLLLSLFLGM